MKVVERHHHRNAVFSRDEAQPGQILWRIGQLVVNQFDAAGLADSADQRYHCRFGDRQTLSAFGDVAAREQHWNTVGSGTDVLCRSDDLGGVGDGFEEVYPPLEHVGPLGQYGRQFVLDGGGILASQVKDFEVYDFPFMFANVQEADAVVDGPLGQRLHAKLADKGIVGLAYFELGFRNITNGKRPINKVEDIAGLKLRVIPNAINVDWVKAVGANPTPMAFPEVYAGLEQGAIDGQENPFSVILANKFYEVQKNLAVTNHQYNPQSLVMSKKIWDTLSADHKKIIQDAAVEAAKYERQVNRDAAASQLAELKKAGMQVTELSATEQAKLREKFKPVIDKHGAAIAATVAELQAELAKLRK